MPLYFHFYYSNPHNPEEDKIFNGRLESKQCEFIKANHQRCRRRCVIGLPCCSSHMPIKYKVKIGNSGIANGGKGLFAVVKTIGDNDIVFRGQRPSRLGRALVGETICPYYGEVLDNDEMERRYADKTAPYGIEINDNRYEDASLVRGVGSIINHKPKAQSNCEFYVSTRDNLVYLRAIKNIRNGHELFVNYGKDYHLNEEGVHTATNHSKYW